MTEHLFCRFSTTCGNTNQDACLQETRQLAHDGIAEANIAIPRVTERPIIIKDNCPKGCCVKPMAETPIGFSPEVVLTTPDEGLHLHGSFPCYCHGLVRWVCVIT